MAEGKIDIEQRKHPRASVNLDVRYEWLRTGSKVVSQASDISVGGLRVYSNSQPRKDDLLRLSISLDDGKTVDADGTVMWVARTEELGLDVDYEYAFGLKFAGMGDDDAWFVAQLVDRCIKG